MEGKPKVTKEVLCEESRFILANVLAEARYGRQNTYEDIRRVCEGAVSIPFGEYVTFLEAAGYLRQDGGSEILEVSEAGEEIVNGGNLSELTQAAVAHFKSERARRRKDGSGPAALLSDSIVSEPAAPRRSAIASSGRPRAKAPGRTSESGLEGRYEKLSSLGSGGFGTVFRARQVSLDREVALKEIRELFGFFPEDQHGEIVRRFTDVVRQSAALAHSNILPIHEASLNQDYPYVVSELAPFGSARRLIDDADNVPVALVLKYLMQVLHALSAAHREDVTHRGLKPENLLIDAYGNVKVSDFGLAKLVERDATVIRQVYVGMGAVAYMAPELFQDPQLAGVQADIYALGIIFYEMLTGKLPGRRSPMPSEIDSQLPRGIDDIFDVMTRDSLSERYSSVDDILADLDKIDGLTEVLGNETSILVADNPLVSVKFRPGTDMASIMAGDDEADHAGEDVVSSADPDGGDDTGSRKRRPYSFQQRNKK